MDADELLHSGAIPALTEADLAVYRKVRRREALDLGDKEHFERLVELKLVVEDPYSPGQFVHTGRREAEALLRESAHAKVAAGLADLRGLPGLLEQIELAHCATGRGESGIEWIDGLDAVNDAITNASLIATKHLLTAQPGPRPPDSLVRSTTRDLGMLARGVSMRTLYSGAGRAVEHQRAYVARVTAAGAQVRTMTEEFHRSVIIDDCAFVLDHVEGRTHMRGAYCIRHPAVVALLVAEFELKWHRAAVWRGTEDPTVNTISNAFQRSVLRELLAGRTQQQAATELKVSSKTVNAALAELRLKLGHKTLAQLVGWWATSEERHLPD
ncbi:LuxR C-terminal-related transcriptional regulator [Streptomyces sp. NBC_01304]|uniref:LuxR C-terminal-related transcriptional regulator n=1 Tax=Streptomyces sp. NBC_01304 TaxID=2903818 RepID=UPI002E0DD802|nr:LuxR C-terminal-related transcriptional regulator [Streptomyces sp. NBC_01304]